MIEHLDLSKIVVVLVASILAFFGWFGKRNVDKIDYLASNCVTRNEYESLRKEMNEGFNRIYDKMDEKS